LTESEIVVERDRWIATITLNRPAKRNALTRAMLERLVEEFDRLDAEPDLRVVILRAAGESFCAGVDLSEMLRDRESQGDVDHGLLEQVFGRLEGHRNPIIAQVQGPALAGGCELALHCDIRVASPAAAFGMPLARIGIVVPFVLGLRLADLAGISVATDLLLSGESVDGTRALQCGLISRLEVAEQLPACTRRLAERIAANAPLAVREMKRVVKRSVSRQGVHSEDLDQARLAVSQSEDVREGLRAFLERRSPVFKGA
jgi:enoyl-CoA hydratase